MITRMIIFMGVAALVPDFFLGENPSICWLLIIFHFMAGGIPDVQTLPDYVGQNLDTWREVWGKLKKNPLLGGLEHWFSMG